MRKTRTDKGGKHKTRLALVIAIFRQAMKYGRTIRLGYTDGGTEITHEFRQLDRRPVKHG